MKVRFLGHAAFMLEGTRKVLIDPFLSGNPKAALGPNEITDCDIIVVTHDHGDHLGDAFSIAQRTGAVIVSQHEIATRAQEKGLAAEGMNIGGPVSVKGVRIWLTDARHTSATGAPTGAVIEMDAKRVYHAGDTGLFGDMKLIGELFRPHVALLPIGGRYTMDVSQAVRAALMIGAPVVIPMHYNTFPLIQADPQEFKERVEAESEGKIRVVVLAPGQVHALVSV